MKKHFAISVFLIFCATLGYGQILTAPNIVALNGNSFCASSDFAPDRPHVCLVSGNPLPIYEDMYVSYTWIVRHPQGSFVWNTYSHERIIPVPWPGKYTVKLIVKYFRGEKKRPFAAILSNTLELYGEDCTVKKEG